MGGGGSTSVPKTPPFKTSAEMAPFIQAPTGVINDKAIAADAAAYQRSDMDFSARHRPIRKAEKLFEASVLDDWQRKDTLSPALQAEFTRSGLGASIGALGDASGAVTATPGAEADAREASIARNLGMSILDYQQLQRGNRMNSLGAANEMFQRRTFGFGGEGTANIELANIAGQNNWNQADYQNQVSIDQLNHNTQAQNVSNQMAQGNANAANKSSQNAALIGGGAAVAGALLLVL